MRGVYRSIVNKMSKIAFGSLCGLLCLFLFMTPVKADTATRTAGGTTAPPPAMAGEEGAVEGMAYYYHRQYYRQRTSSGARYDARKLTVAHPTLPLGAKVKVVNLANERSVVVTVNDRCRKRSFELIDVSQAAARKLGFYGKGHVRVRIIPLAAAP